MDLNIENKVALVAASSRGLGKAIALQLSNRVQVIDVFDDPGRYQVKK